MGEKQWCGARAAASNVDKVNVEVVDLREELRILIQACFGFAPIEAGGPVGAQILEIVVAYAVLPAALIDAVRPRGVADARQDTVYRWLRDSDSKRARGGILRPRKYWSGQRCRYQAAPRTSRQHGFTPS